MIFCARRKKVNILYVHTIIYSDERSLQNLLFSFLFCFVRSLTYSTEIQMFQPFHIHYFTKYAYIYFCLFYLTYIHTRLGRNVTRKKSKDRKDIRCMNFFFVCCCCRRWQRYLIAHNITLVIV